MDCRKLSPEAREHAVQNERLPLRVVVRVLFFAGAGGLSPENRGYYGSSVSAATTNTSEDWDGVPTVEDMEVARSTRSVAGASETSGGGGGGVDRAGGAAVLTPKMILSKIWSSRGGHLGRAPSGSDTSESAGSATMEEPKSTPSRSTRYSVS